MQKVIFILLFSISFFAISSCEKVIDIPLNEAEQKVVVEAVFKDSPGDNYVILSKTGSVYTQNNFEKISGASVIITDQSGNNYTLNETTSPGIYNHPTFSVLENQQYVLSIVTGQDTFTSVSNSFTKPTLDSLNYIEQIGSFGVGTDTTFLVFFSFVDNGIYDNHYRVKAFVNNVFDENLYIANDELFNGQNYTQPVFATTIEKGDTVLIELISMDKSNYTYFFSLSSNAGDDPFAATPANPVSNIEGGAIGYFGVYTTDTLSLILPQ